MRRERSVPGVEGEQRLEVDVGDAVGVGRAEAAARRRARREQLDAPARLRLQAGVDALDRDALPASGARPTKRSISSPL